MSRLWSSPLVRALVLSRFLEFIGVALLVLPLGELVEKSHFEDIEFEEEGGFFLLEFLRFAKMTSLSPEALIVGLVLGGVVLLLRAPVEFFATFPGALPKAASDRLLFGGRRLLARFALTAASWLVVGVTGYLVFSRSGIESDPLPKLVAVTSVAWISKTFGILLEFEFAEADLLRSGSLGGSWLRPASATVLRRVALGLGLSLVEILGPLGVLWLSIESAANRPLAALGAEGILTVLVALRLAYLRALASSSWR